MEAEPLSGIPSRRLGTRKNDMIVSRSHTLYGNELRKALPSLILNYGGRASQWHSQSETGNEEKRENSVSLMLLVR